MLATYFRVQTYLFKVDNNCEWSCFLTVGRASDRRKTGDAPLANGSRGASRGRAITILPKQGTVQRYGHTAASASTPARHTDNFIKSDDTCTLL